MVPLSLVLAWALAGDGLQDLVDRTPAGGTLRLEPGVYRGPLLVSRPLTIEGGGRAIIDGGGSGTLVSVSKVPVVLRGLVLRGSGDSFHREDAALRLEEADGSIVEDCRLEDVLFGLYVARSSHCVFRRLFIGGKALPMPRRGDGVRLWYSNDTLLEGITMADSRDFIIWFGQRTTVRGCRVAGGRYGLHYMNCEDNVFEDNVFVDNQVGGTIMYSRRITLRRNRFLRSRGPSAYGMLLKDADGVVAEGNEFVDNSRGLYFDNTPDTETGSCMIRGNLFALNDSGVSILPSTRRVRFEGNAFVDNLSQVEIIGHADPAKNSWEGNYWSDHAAYDADGDGRGDVPYRPESVYEDLLASHPSLALLRFSPSISAIELAGRLFPVTRTELKLEDARPAVRIPALPAAPAEGAERGPDPAVLAGAALLALLPLAVVGWAGRVLR